MSKTTLLRKTKENCSPLAAMLGFGGVQVIPVADGTVITHAGSGSTLTVTETNMVSSGDRIYLTDRKYAALKASLQS